MEKHCCICGAAFRARPSEKRATCGRQECRAERIRQQLREFYRKNEEYLKQHRVTVNCVICGKPMELPAHRVGHKKTCSPECLSQLRHRNNCARFQGGLKVVKTCCICGKQFRTVPSAENKTCSKECQHKLQSFVSSKHDLAKMLAKRRTSPHCQPDENHYGAKDWRLRSPNGTVYEFRNLSHFVRTHRELFLPEQLREGKAGIYAMFRLGDLRPGRTVQRKNWCGWTWEE